MAAIARAKTENRLVKTVKNIKCKHELSVSLNSPGR